MILDVLITVEYSFFLNRLLGYAQRKVCTMTVNLNFLSEFARTSEDFKAETYFESGGLKPNIITFAYSFLFSVLRKAQSFCCLTHIFSLMISHYIGIPLM